MDEDHSQDDSTPHMDACKAWLQSQVAEGALTLRDISWLERNPSFLIDYYPVLGVLLGFTAAGAASRFALRSTLRPWSFTRTITTAGFAGTAGYYAGSSAHDWAIAHFNKSTDSPTTAMVARFKLKNAAAKDQVEHMLSSARRRQNEEQMNIYQRTLAVMDSAEEEYAEDVVLESMVAEDVQVYSATNEEIQNAVEEIVQVAMDGEGVPITRHDTEMLTQHEIQYWKDRPISAPRDPGPTIGVVVGGLGIYGRLMRTPPLGWRWLAFSIIPVWVTSSMYYMGFGKFGGSNLDDWWMYQVAGMEVRSSIARTIAISRARRILREGGSQVGSLLGSKSNDERIQLLLPQSSGSTSESADDTV